MSASPSANSSKAARDSMRRRMTDLGSPRSAIAQEMRVEFGLRPREAWRCAHGWSMQEVVDRIHDLSSRQSGESIAADTSAVSKWERWPASTRKPTVPVLLALAAIYGCTVEDLLDLEDRGALSEGDLAVLSRLTSAEPNGSQLVRMAADESLTWARWAESSNVGDISLEQLWGRTRILASQYLEPDSHPIGLFARTRELRGEVMSLLEGHQHPDQASDLYAISGYLCGLLAWMSSDLGHVAEAETQGLTAWLCAELAGRDALRAWVLSVRSKTAFWNRRLKEAVQHARRGATYQASGTIGVLLACQEADAWSQLGAEDEALAALARADAAREAVNGVDDIGGLFSCAPARQENYNAAVQLRIGRAPQALRAADRALHLLSTQPVRAYGTLAQIHISRAAAHLALGEPEGAHQALRPVLALAPDRRLSPVTDRLEEISRTLVRLRGGSREGVSLRAAIEDFRQDSAVQRLALSPGHGSG
ncbi:helix-turn-helix domain-containing protein [Streptomyces olivaceus]|uniref:helix-turn-helix domain-containing protein n=1 Tax=Streptomyces olivaceus TaxID=47716 RepID=UPI002491A6C5|nr:helix-turn-helix transcriptional regulator [Streptomyces olivaceus]